MITITEAEQIVHKRLGANWTCVKLGRYWLVGTLEPRWNLVSQAGTLDKAIRQAETEEKRKKS